MPAIGSQVLHEDNIQARTAIEVEIAHNQQMVRINVDGICVLRIKGAPRVTVKMDDPEREQEYETLFGGGV